MAREKTLERNELSQAQLEAFHELIEGEPQVLFILVGAMKYNSITSRYESGSFKDVDENSKLSTGVALATGGKDRMLAAAKFHKVFPEALIVTMSRTRDESKPTYAAVMRDELIQRGVPVDKIILEEESVSTITEFKEASRMWEKGAWTNIVFISSEWHIPRSKALFNHIENFAESADEAANISAFAEAVRSGELRVQFVSSTDVLQIGSARYRAFFTQLAEDEGMKQRIIYERRGLEQIANGEYGGFNLSKKLFV